MSRLAVLCAGALLALAPLSAHAQKSPAAAGRVVVIRMDTSVTAFDMSPTGSTRPPGWLAPQFDDSSWDHVSLVPKASLACVQDAVPGFGVIPELSARWYWGPLAQDRYLFRQRFSVPKAKAYYGSFLAFKAIGPPYSVILNAVHLTGYDFRAGLGAAGRVSIDKYLHPGTNVMGFDVTPGRCPGLNDTITIRLAGAT